MLALPMTLFEFQNFAFISESLSGEFRSGFHKGSAGPGCPALVPGDQMWPGVASSFIPRGTLRSFRQGESSELSWVC